MASWKLCKDGRIKIVEAKYTRGWKIPAIAMRSNTSESTVKRFLTGKQISEDNFIALCKTLGIEDWYNLVENEDEDNDSTKVNSNELEPVPNAPELEEEKYGIAVSGSFTESQKAQIEAVVDLLKDLLVSSRVKISVNQKVNN